MAMGVLPVDRQSLNGNGFFHRDWAGFHFTLGSLMIVRFLVAAGPSFPLPILTVGGLCTYGNFGILAKNTYNRGLLAGKDEWAG
jgi:hypothetical protein